MLAKLRFDPSRPIIARAAGRALVGSLNFTIASLIQQHLRRERFGASVPEASGIDGLNDAAADAAADVEAGRVREEQGFAITADPLELAARLKLVRDSVAGDLLKNAGRRQMATRPGETFPDPFHIGASFAESLDFQLRTQPRMASEAALRAEAKALNVSLDDVKAALTARHVRQINLLRDSRDDIERIYGELTPKGSDGHPLGVEADEEVFAKLPAIVQLRLVAAADKGLFRARQRELELHFAGRSEAAGNIALLDGTRRELLAMVNRWMEKPQFKAELDDATSRGANQPTFAPAPHEQQPDEKEEALRKKAA